TLGLFVTLEAPTRAMQVEAESVGFYVTPLGKVSLPRLQIRTVEQLLRGEGFQIPSAAMLMGVSRAERVQEEVWQGELEM
ncbi:MAG: hypothetical protein NZ749_14865, partial [bacterium]|nr:hypothetical protein [bacterium]